MVLPLRAILFQVLFLLIAVAIEAMILRWRLKMGPKKSVGYAASLNLLSTVAGWLIFFFAAPRLSPDLKAQLISYIFFNNFFSPPAPSSPVFWIVQAATLIFFITLFIKIRSYQLFQYLNKPKLKRAEGTGERRATARSEYPLYVENAVTIGHAVVFGEVPHKKTLSEPKNLPNSFVISRRQAIALLWAHAASHSAILLILFCQSYFSQRP
ncbi:filament integrity protein FraC [Kamptonema formosum]|uniref:filament integrity protein FraC n=1 Tax=Kamptonema formosum TaxID=331992 RepID=UPI000345562F|nr:filament integrity protein FraC [Oscillatoria sp. PCC 10802]